MDSTFGFGGKLGEPATTPAELNGPLPRTVRITGNGITVAVIALLFAIFCVTLGAWMGWKGEKLIEHRDALRRDGVEVSGQVTRVWRSGRSNNHLAYTFEAGGVEYNGESQMSTAIWRGLWADRSLAIRYLPTNPDINHPAGWEESDSSAWLPLVAPLILLLTSIMLFYQLRLDRQLTLVGLPAIGTVTRCARRKNGFSIGFKFRTQTGIESRGGGWSPVARENGDRISVLYLPENPRRSQPYPFANYRVGG